MKTAVGLLDGGDEDFLRSSLRKELEDRRIGDEAERLQRNLGDFIEAAWPTLKPDIQYQRNWHIDAIADKLTAVSRGEIKRLQIWIPPQSMKSLLASVMWPAWEWTFAPHISYWTASYSTDLSGRLSAMSMTIMKSRWYQERWGSGWKFTRDAESFFANDHGGIRLATSVGAETGTGYHGDRILIDDAINAAAADATSQVRLQAANEWMDGTVGTRGIGPDHARVIIMQRLHHEDLAAHVLEGEEDEWYVLCLPERYEPDHPFVWPDDPRTKDGELLWPDYRPEEMSNALARRLGSHRAAGQLQQRPAPREGQMLLRKWWRFYPPGLMEDAKRRPPCHAVVISVDTPLRDAQQNDLVAIQAWGVKGADRYLIDLRSGHLSESQAKRAIIEMSRHVRKLFPRAQHYVLIENAGYGPTLITQLKREITGVTKIAPGQEGDKVLRADSASDALEFGNCWLQGYGAGADETLGPVKTASADVVEFIEELAMFDNGRYDDQVDAWSQCMIWLKNRPIRRGRTMSPFKTPRRDDRRDDVAA